MIQSTVTTTTTTITTTTTTIVTLNAPSCPSLAYDADNTLGAFSTIAQ